MPEQVFRGALLLDLPFGHDHDPVPQGHRLGLVVGDVDHVLAQAVAHSGQLRAHPGAQVRIQVRERLVEQEGRRVPHQRPPHGHALALPPGQLGRLAVQQVGDVEGLRDALDLAPDLGLGDTLQPQREGHVLRDVHVRVERVVLEHHRHVAILRREVADGPAVEEDLAAARALQAGQDAQGRRFPAAGRADEHRELAVGEVQIDRRQDADAAEALLDLLEPDGRQPALLSEGGGPVQRRWIRRFAPMGPWAARAAASADRRVPGGSTGPRRCAGPPSTAASSRSRSGTPYRTPYTAGSPRATLPTVAPRYAPAHPRATGPRRPSARGWPSSRPCPGT